MAARTQAQYEARARVLKALAHPTRLLVIDALTRGPRCVCELTALAGADMSTVSKHLAVLKAAGLVQDTKRGAQVYYALECPCVADFFRCVESVLKSNARRQAALAR